VPSRLPSSEGGILYGEQEGLCKLEYYLERVRDYENYVVGGGYKSGDRG